eukprot:1067550-Amphidinium_carterae.1
MDSDADGFVEGVHAKEIMEKSALPEHDLLEIWALADSDQESRVRSNNGLTNAPESGHPSWGNFSSSCIALALYS